MNKETLVEIQEKTGIRPKSIMSVGGGSISEAFIITTATEKLFLKFHKDVLAYDMFEKEGQGLRVIQETNTIATPKIHFVNQAFQGAYLIMDYIETKPASSKDHALLGSQLAELHHNSISYFGLDHVNFIGPIKQMNTPFDDWTDFYIENRIYPQLELAVQNGFIASEEIMSKEKLKTTCSHYFNEIQPALLHGDLWSGNYIIAKDGTPYLIDPALYYGHSEVDIAMTKLFGGFDTEFYKAYYEIQPQPEHPQAYQDLYQLYYLLVHLNLFGSSYYSGVKRILDRYFI
ncbi:MAG: fructosamine kinase family protein [Flavobacteriaceae bacterium]|nr:fructosamine kinase family protein [Flavobacteriaceae bacterium]